MSESPSGKGGEKSLKSAINVFIAFSILAIALALTGLYTLLTKQSVEDEFIKDFSFECNEIKSSVQTRLHAHAALLRAGAAYIEASDTVSRKEWDIFINHQKINKNLPGVQGIGYAMILSGELLEKHEQHIRASGFPQYKIMPAGKRELYTTIIYLEPFSERNLAAFGYDMFSEAVRREAMEKARDFDIASLSGKVNLVQENDTDVQSGMLLYVPVYRQGMPVNTVAERRKAIKGWSFSPYRMNDFMLGVLGNYETKLKETIRMQIYDNDDINSDALMFDSRSGIADKNLDSRTLGMKLPLVFNEKHWTLYFSKVLQFRSFYFHKDVYLVLLGGIAISFLIFILALLLFRNRYRLELTTELARNLEESSDAIKAALKEKEILLSEVHHRVKNNLQVVSSLLNLQANKIPEKAIKEILEQSRNRIRSIALVHEKLYQTGNFAEINIKEYTRSLINELFRVYLADPQKIHIHTAIEDVNVPLVYAIPYGLILNEIISNSLKYAFPEDHTILAQPEIFVQLKTLHDNRLQFIAGDNGIGLPADYMVNESLSLGLYLIRILATEQLDGEISIDNEKGTIFTITFNPYAK